MDRDPNHIERARNPIFLVQSKQYQFVDLPTGIENDEDSYYVDDMNYVDPSILCDYCDDDGYIVDEDGFLSYCVEFDYATEYWKTETVMLTRSEAENWAESHPYLFSHGLRVHCVSCKGELANILNKV